MADDGRNPPHEAPAGDAYWILGVLAKRKWSALIVSLTAALGGVVYYLTAPRLFESRFEISIKQEAIPEELTALRQMSINRTESVKSHVQLVQSGQVLRKALIRANRLKDGDPEDLVQSLVAGLRKDTSVRIKEDGAREFEVRVAADAPQFAKQKAGHILSAYMAVEEEQRKGHFQENLKKDRDTEDATQKEIDTCQDVINAFNDVEKCEARVAALAAEEQAAVRRLLDFQGRLVERKSKLKWEFDDRWYVVSQLNKALEVMDFAIANYANPSPRPALASVPLTPPAGLVFLPAFLPDRAADLDGDTPLNIVLARNEREEWDAALAAARAKRLERERCLRTEWDRGYLAIWRKNARFSEKFGEFSTRRDIEGRKSEREQKLVNLRQEINKIQQSIKDSKSPVNVIEDPSLPSGQISPQPLKVALFTLLAMFVLAILVVYFQEISAPSLISVDEVSHFTGKQVLGIIPHMNPATSDAGPADEYPVLAFLPEGRVRPYSESYRILKTNVTFALPNVVSPAILMTSSYPSEGKSTVCSNLALAFAEEGNRTVILECNLRRPSMAAKFSLQRSPGMTDILEKDADWHDFVCPTFMPNPSLIQMGRLSDKSSVILNRNRFGRLIDSLKLEFDVILVDSPPSLLVTDAALLSTQVDGVVLVYALGLTPKNELRRAVALFARVKNNLLGIVANGRQAGLFYQRQKHYYRAEKKGAPKA
jgi:capsular exopolysaccharide synthesis family protein